MDFYEEEPISLYLSDLSLLEERISPLQTIRLMSHPWMGKILIIDGEIQHIEKYQSLYHEMLVHLPISFLPSPESVLIIGGGSLFAAHEALKYPSVKKVVLCDYDHNVIDIMIDYYPHAREVVSDLRFQYIEQEGLAFIEQEKDRYDLIINDCFNLALESKLHGLSYFTKLSNLNSTSGVCVDIIYRHIFDQQTTIDTLRYLKSEQNIALSLVTVPEYPGILHIETIWGKNPSISQTRRTTLNELQQMVIKGKVPTPFLFFSPQHLPYYLYLPPYIKNLFSL